MKGVDISHYQAGITIRQIMDAGMDFAIIKVTEGTSYIDPSAFEFYQEAHELGFPLGCYCYSHAINAQQAMAEAAFLTDTTRGFPMPCGVYLDIEEPDQLSLPHDTLLNIIRGWCAGIGGKGYVPGIYASEGNLWAKVSPEELPDGCLVWIAKWSQTPPNTPCDIWQFSDRGNIPGYDGPVDSDSTRGGRITALIDSAAQAYEQHKRELAQEDSPAIQPDNTLAPDACPIQKPNPFIGIMQMMLNYKGCWGEVDGQKSPEFFAVARAFLDELERG